MSDFKKWMDIVVGAEVLASKLADIQTHATAALSQEESKKSEGSEITINLTLNPNGTAPEVSASASPIQSQGVEKTAVVVQPAAPGPAAPGPAAPAPASKAQFKENDTVYISPAVGGGVGRFVSYTKNGAIIDIKGVFRELSVDHFTSLNQQYKDAFERGNEWFHQTATPDTPGAQNDKPEFRAGDMVRVEDVYGAVVGPGFGIFIAYGTTGEDCIISFDNKKIVVPVANVSPVLEQESKDNFSEMDNDGNLSPISFGSENRTLEEDKNKEPAMDHKDEFTKWMDTVEEALTAEVLPVVDVAQPGPECGCGAWNCEVCFPPVGGDQAHAHDSTGCPACQGMGCPACDGSELEEEEPMAMTQEKPRSGKGVKLGDIVTKFVPSDGQESPLTHGEANLGEEIPQGADPADYGKAGRYLQKHFGDGDLDENWYDPEPSEFAAPDFDADPLAVRDYHNEMNGAPKSEADVEQALDMIAEIKYMQNSGLSMADRNFSEDEMANMGFDQLKDALATVRGEVATENYAPGTAPTMPESTQGLMTMEQVDKDVAAMLASLKKYDTLKESVAPVLGMKTLNEKGKKPDFLDVDKDDNKKESWTKAEKDKKEGQSDSEGGEIDESEDKNPWLDLASDKKGKDEKEEVGKTSTTHKGGTVTKTEKGLVHKKADESVEVNEGADQDVLAWMSRFAKLGNMKGYGR